jgi:hypothetical protein
MKFQMLAATAALSLGLSTPTFANVFVPGDANPNLAGQPNGTTCCAGALPDTAPAQSPVLAVSGIAPGSAFNFSAVGITDGAGTGPTGPDGSYLFGMTDYGLGVAPAGSVGVLGLVGVFLDNSTPTGGSQPAGLSFAGGLNFTTLSPGLNQIFWIGDGLTGTGSGILQNFVAPLGATRLFLGTVDGFEWNNNTGGYDVSIMTSVPCNLCVPEPSVWALMLAGFGLAGTALRRRRFAAA